MASIDKKKKKRDNKSLALFVCVYTINILLKVNFYWGSTTILQIKQKKIDSFCQTNKKKNGPECKINFYLIKRSKKKTKFFLLSIKKKKICIATRYQRSCPERYKKARFIFLSFLFTSFLFFFSFTLLIVHIHYYCLLHIFLT